jgi:hypothetical protein
MQLTQKLWIAGVSVSRSKICFTKIADSLKRVGFLLFADNNKMH